MNPTILLAALALASAELSPPEPTPEPASSPEPAVAAEHVTTGGARHAITAGWHAMTFFSDEGSQYTFHSASLGYQGSWGNNRPFVSAAWLLPLQARQDGVVYPTSTYYSRRLGGDLLLGWQWRFRPWDGAEGEAGPGFHANLVWLPPKTGYREFVAFPMGLGAQGVVRWKTRQTAFSRTVVLGSYCAVSYDFHDPLHAYDLSHGFSFRLGLAASLGGRP